MKIKIWRQLDELGRVIIPVDLRRHYGLEPGDKVWFSTSDHAILIHPEDYTDNDDNKGK